MDPKPRPNHQAYLEALSRMTAELKLDKVVEPVSIRQRRVSGRIAGAVPDGI